MTIDFHTHCFPDAIAARAVPMLSEHSGIPHFADGTVGDLRSSMRCNGIDASVLLQIATKPAQTPSVNTWAIEQDSADIIGFGSVHPEYPQWRDELDRMAAAGLKGIKLHPDYQTFFVDADPLRPIYEHAISCGLILVFHAGVDVGLPDPVHCTPQRLLAVYDILRHGRVVLAHMGGWRLWRDVEAELSGSTFFFDTSYCSGKLPDEDFVRMIRRHGVNRILFGSDSPWEDQAESLAGVRALGLTSAEETAVLGGNAARLLGMELGQ